MKRRTLAQWLDDMRWAMNAQRARRMRREMTNRQCFYFDISLMSSANRFYGMTTRELGAAYIRAKSIFPGEDT